LPEALSRYRSAAGVRDPGIRSRLPQDSPGARAQKWGLGRCRAGVPLTGDDQTELNMDEVDTPTKE